MIADLPNIHATALVIGDRGLLIRGASGSGKTTLALTLILDAGLQRRHAALVADDQLLIEAQGGALLASAPLTIEGLAEVYGLGPRAVVFRPRARIDVVVDLADLLVSPRFQDEGEVELAGVSLPSLALPARQTRQASLAVMAWLGLTPFGV